MRAIRFDITPDVVGDSGAKAKIEDGVILVDAPTGFVGTVDIDVTVSSASAAFQVDRFDRQRISIEVGPDVNGDGEFNVADVDVMCFGSRAADGVMQRNIDFFSITVGDVNLDGVFNSTDLIRMFEAAEYQDGIEENSSWSTGDFNCDGDFGTSDLAHAFKAATYSGE